MCQMIVVLFNIPLEDSELFLHMVGEAWKGRVPTMWNGRGRHHYCLQDHLFLLPYICAVPCAPYSQQTRAHQSWRTDFKAVTDQTSCPVNWQIPHGYCLPGVDLFQLKLKINLWLSILHRWLFQTIWPSLVRNDWLVDGRNISNMKHVFRSNSTKLFTSRRDVFTVQSILLDLREEQRVRREIKWLIKSCNMHFFSIPREFKISLMSETQFWTCILLFLF